MFKRLLIVILLLGLSIGVTLIETQGYMEEYPDPFSYYTVEEGKQHYLYSTAYFEIPQNPTLFQLRLPNTSYNIYTSTMGGITYSSWFTLYDGNLQNSNSFQLSLFDEYREPYGDYILGLSAIQFHNIDNYKYFRIEIIQNYGGHARADYLEWWNARFKYAFDEELEPAGNHRIQYVVGDTLYYENLYSGTPDKPVDPQFDNLIFMGWYMPNGVLYDFKQPLPLIDGVPSDYILRANFKISSFEGNVGGIDNTPDVLTNVLIIIGFNSPFGKILIYLMVLVAITVALLWIKIDLFIMLLVNIIVFGLFIFLGWLPVYMIIIMGLLFITGIITSLIKGGT